LPSGCSSAACSASAIRIRSRRASKVRASASGWQVRPPTSRTRPRATNGVLAVGCWLVLWTGYTCSKTLVLAHAAIWRVEPPRLGKPLRASLLFSGCTLGFIVAMGAARWVRGESEVGGLVSTILVIGVPFAIWLLVSRALPNGAQEWLELVPGAVVMGVGLQAMHLFTAYFLGPKLSSATQLYGLVGVVTTMLFWFYLGGRLIVASATLNAEVAETRAPKPSVALGDTGGEERRVTSGFMR